MNQKNVEAIAAALIEVAALPTPEESKIWGYTLDDVIQSGPLRYFIASALAARGVLVPSAITDAEMREVQYGNAFHGMGSLMRSALERIAKGETQGGG